MSKNDSPAGSAGGAVVLPDLDVLPEKMRVHALAKLIAVTRRAVPSPASSARWSSRSSAPWCPGSPTALLTARVLRARLALTAPAVLRAQPALLRALPAWGVLPDRAALLDQLAPPVPAVLPTRATPRRSRSPPLPAAAPGSGAALPALALPIGPPTLLPTRAQPIPALLPTRASRPILSSRSPRFSRPPRPCSRRPRGPPPPRTPPPRLPLTSPPRRPPTRTPPTTSTTGRTTAMTAPAAAGVGAVE